MSAISITVTDPSPEQAEAIFAAYFAHNTTPGEAEPNKPTRTTKPKAETEPSPAPEPEAQPDVADEADEQVAGPSRTEVEDAARALVKANGRDAMAEALAKFGASNLSTLKEKDYAKFIAHCEKAAK